jgi:WD40 repeat protein
MTDSGPETTRMESLIGRHEDTVSSAAFSPDGSRIVTASWDLTGRIWDAATGKEIVPRANMGTPYHLPASAPMGRASSRRRGTAARASSPLHVCQRECRLAGRIGSP